MSRTHLGRWTLSHVHFRAAALVVNLVHELLHQENAASVFSAEIFGRQRVGDILGIEAGAFVTHDERNTVLFSAIATNMHTFRGILTISVKHRVCERFAQRQLDRKFAARIAMDVPGF